MPNSPLLTISDLHVEFVSGDKRTPVLHGISLDILQGETLALVGESGSGKSITALAILQLLGSSGRISKGEITFQKESLQTKDQKEMQKVRGKKIGIIFQDPMTSLNPTLSIGWQIAEGIIYHESISYKAAKLRAIEFLDLVGIADPKTRYDSYPFQLSGGMRQRVMIAIALACNPLLLIADEPTTALDATIQIQILELLKQIQRDTKMSLLLITHDLGVVANTCDRVAVMQHGHIVETATIEKLFTAAEHPYSQALLAARFGVSSNE